MARPNRHVGIQIPARPRGRPQAAGTARSRASPIAPGLRCPTPPNPPGHGSPLPPQVWRTKNKNMIDALVAKTCPTSNYTGKKVLLIVPDSTRTAPVGALFKAIHQQIGGVTRNLDVLIALGTHQPMS